MKKILIVDDFAYIQLLFKRSLDKEGFKAIQAKTAAEATSLIGQEEIDLIILDINLPDMNGVDLLKELRDRNITIPVIIVSAFASPEVLNSIASLDVSAVFPKPVVLTDFIGRVKEILLGIKPDTASAARMLVVDDQEQVGMLMERTFTKDGYHVIWVHDGYEALSHLAHEKFCGIVVDLSLPGMDGFSLIQKIREKEPEVPVVVITAYPSREAIIKCKAMNVNDIFAKPLKLSEFRARIRNMFKQ
jgi:DNA-binding response OmpR family regulator